MDGYTIVARNRRGGEYLHSVGAVIAEYYMRWACYSSMEQAVKAIRLETSKGKSSCNHDCWWRIADN